MLRALEWLLAAPWRLVVVATVVIGVPLVVVGELSDADARARIRAYELRLTSDEAARASDLITDQLATIRVQLSGAAADPNLKRILQDKDEKALLALTQDLRSVMSRDIRRLFVLDPNDVVLAEEPSEPGLAATSLRDTRIRRARPSPSYGGLFGPYSQVFISDDTGGPALFISVGVTDRGAASGYAVGYLFADVDLRFIHDWLAPSAKLGQEVYVLDEQGRLVARASVPRTERDARLLNGFADHPVVAQAISGTPASADARDPVSGAPRLVAASPVADLGWQTMIARDPNEVEQEAGAALTQLRLSRLALVVLILIGTYVLAVAARGLVRQRAALAETNTQLAHASQAKSQFLASVSHELRTPMNAILGFTDALLAGVDGPLNDEQRASLTWVQRGGQDLLTLINEILDLSKIESGKLVVAPELFLPTDLVESVCAQYRSLAAQKGLHLGWRDEGMPTEVHLDRQRTRQILVNLVGNSLKFTTEGQVEIVGDSHDGELRLSVRDSGPGIAAEQLEAIFEDFRQVAGTVGGTGLGLAIGRRLARLMGGDITVVTEVGRGSTFTVTLPADMRGALSEVAQPSPRRPERTLLLAIDDDPSVAPLLGKMLADRGYDVVATTDPGMAVADARRLRPNVITLDMLMPERDGRDVFADLRADASTRDIPIIALTVVDKADIPAEANAHLIKPIRKDRLLRTLEEVVPVTIGAR